MDNKFIRAIELLKEGIASVEADMSQDFEEAETTGDRPDLWDYDIMLPLHLAKALCESAPVVDVDALCSSPIIEGLTPTNYDWGRCESIQDRYDLMRRLIRSALPTQVQDAASKPPYQNDAVWARFYRDGKTLGEISEEFKCGIYDLSPWLTAPLMQEDDMEALKSVLAALVALMSLVTRAEAMNCKPSLSVASNSMFRQMMKDYEATVVSAKAAILSVGGRS